MPLIPIQNQANNIRAGEINRINPGYTNLSTAEKFLPIKGVTYIWLLTSQEELIVGIEEPWNHLNAFALSHDNHSVEQIVNQLRAPSAEQADTWKFGHPTLTATFDDAGVVKEEGVGLIGGEFYFSEKENEWIVNNFSGRYGCFSPISEPINREIEKKFQEQVIKTLYIAANEFKKHHISLYLSPNFIEECYDPYTLEKRDLLFQIKGSQRLYNELNKNDQADPEFVTAFTSSYLGNICSVNEDFFTLYKKEAIDILNQNFSIITLLELIERLHHNNNFLELFGEYLEGIIDSEKFISILNGFDVHNKLDFIIRVIDLGKLISKTESNLLSNILVESIKLKIDLNPYCNHLLEKRSALLERGFYHYFPKKLQCNLEVVREFTNDCPSVIQLVDKDFFVLYPNEAMEILDKTGAHVIYNLMNKFHSDPVLLDFIRIYLTSIIHTDIFTELVERCSPVFSEEDSKLLNQFLSWFGLNTIITRCKASTHYLFIILKTAKEMGMDLTGLTLNELPAKTLCDHYQKEDILNLFSEDKRYEFAAEVISLKFGHYKLMEWINSLTFAQLSALLTKKPANLASILDIMDGENVAQFMRFLVNLHLNRQGFNLDLLFDLYFDSNIQIKERKGLRITPINAALIVLDGKKLSILLQEFSDEIIFNMRSALNFLSTVNVSLMEDEKKELLIFSMLNRMVEITKNDYEFEKILTALPKKAQKDNYAELMQAKYESEEQEKGLQLSVFHR